MSVTDRKVETPPSGHRTLIGSRFSNAAEAYDREAEVQRLAAASLAQRIEAVVAPELWSDVDFCGLELGCGTGFLTRHLTTLSVAGSWTLSDIAPGMIAKCRQNLNRWSRSPRCLFNFRELDLYELSDVERYDLVVSNFSLQWMQDLQNWLPRVLKSLKPGGRFLFNTLGRNSFEAWQRKLEAAEHSQRPFPGPPNWATLEDFETVVGDFAAEHLTEFQLDSAVKNWDQRFDGILSFFRHLKAIGANSVPGAKASRLGFSELREWRNQCSDEAITLNYEVIEIQIQKSPVQRVGGR